MNTKYVSVCESVFGIFTPRRLNNQCQISTTCSSQYTTIHRAQSAKLNKVLKLLNNVIAPPPMLAHFRTDRDKNSFMFSGNDTPGSAPWAARGRINFCQRSGARCRHHQPSEQNSVSTAGCATDRQFFGEPDENAARDFAREHPAMAWYRPTQEQIEYRRIPRKSATFREISSQSGMAFIAFQDRCLKPLSHPSLRQRAAVRPCGEGARPRRRQLHTPYPLARSSCRTSAKRGCEARAPPE